MPHDPHLGGALTLPGTSIALKRMGYGAIQLAGPQAWGKPQDPANAIAVLREAVEAGVNHIDTSDFYGPHTTNQLIKRALYPYPNHLVIATKVGYRRKADKSVVPSYSKEELISGIHDNLRNLNLDALDIVNLRMGGAAETLERPIEEPLGVLESLRQSGLIRHIGLSNVTPGELEQAQKITNIVCIQNFYNVLNRDDDWFIDDLAAQGIPYVPFSPLGGITSLHSPVLDEVAIEIGVTPMQVALGWLLQRSKNLLLIPGTSSLIHLRQNLAAASFTLPPEVVARLDELGRASMSAGGGAQ